MRLFKRRKKYVILGAQRIEVKPLALQTTLDLFLLISPYLGLLEHYLPQIQDALRHKRNERPRVLYELLRTMRGEMKESPGDMVKILAHLSGVDPEWLATNGTAQEMVSALPVLDEAHDFRRLWVAIQRLGVSLPK